MGKASEANERGVKLTLKTLGSSSVTGLAVQDLVTILGNLLDNAIDAAAESKGPKEVSLTVESDVEGLDITVRDSGSGVDPAAVEHIFKHGFSTKEPGTFGRGIGLALVRQAVQRLDGTMTITGKGGAQFHVFLPAMAPGTDKEEQYQ
jgi:sensor histidine kinase regulating citrate/malate metabolism